MANSLRLVVITHSVDEFDGANYLLNRLIDNWSAEGIQVEVHADPDGTPPPGDIAFAHIDMTAVTDEYAQLFERYPRVINGRVTDISKSLVSNSVLLRGEHYDGPVMVKTERNFGGIPEFQAGQLRGNMNVDQGVPRPWGRVECLPEYPVFDSPEQVPLGVWRNSNLIVDKFRPEKRENGEFALRVWIFLGDRSIHYQCISNDPIIKSENTIRREPLDISAVPEELIAKREAMGFDYGKFDYGQVDEEVVLYDANKTPGAAGYDSSSARSVENIRILSQGVQSYF